MIDNPYRGLRDSNWWHRSVAGRDIRSVERLYTRRFDISPDDRIATAGSCFAQEISARLTASRLRFMDLEPAPGGLDVQAQRNFGYGLFSARYGNIYSARHLLQLAEEAFEKSVPAEIVWERDGAFFDSKRPAVEPLGLASPGEVQEHRRYHVSRVRAMLGSMNVFIFTFGQTEVWCHEPSGTVYPAAPGVKAGRYDPAVHVLLNQTASEVVGDFARFRAIVHRRNPDCRFILTVSPVPMIATATGQHVLAAALRTKSVLRAAAAELFERFPDVDYFPSYDLVMSPFFGCAFEPDMRAVKPEAIDAIMAMFFAEHDAAGAAPIAADGGQTVCDEELLKGFA